VQLNKNEESEELTVILSPEEVLQFIARVIEEWQFFSPLSRHSDE